MENDLIITDAFEMPTQEEWDKYLSSTIFNKMLIDIDNFKCAADDISKIVFQSIKSIVQAHNNKIGSIKISYCLAKHYYDKGIPDDEWFISPGRDGSSVEYMPHFNPEHYLTRYWYCFYIESLYGKLFSALDSLYRLINNYYELHIPEELKFISKVLDKIKTERSDLFALLSPVKENAIYITAKNYRNDITHGISPNEVKNELIVERNIDTEIMKADNAGHIVPQQIKAALKISGRVGDYVTTRELLKSVEDFSNYIGDIITKAVAIISNDTFSIAI